MAAEVFILQPDDQCYASSTSLSRHQKSRSWTDTEIKQLIHLWSTNTMLYDSKDKDYFKSEKRKTVIEGIAANLGICYSDTIKKMESLRAYYGREKWRAYTYNKKAAPGDSYKSRWCYYEPLKFLEDHMTFKRRVSSFSGVDEEPESQDSSPESFYVVPGKTAKKIKASTVQLDSFAVEERSNSNSHFDMAYPGRPDIFSEEKFPSKSRQEVMCPVSNNQIFPGVEDDPAEEPEMNHLLPNRIVERAKPVADNPSSICEAKVETPFIKTALESKHPDIVFAELVARNLMDFPDGADKEILKLQIQTVISCAKYPQIRANSRVQQSLFVPPQPPMSVHAFQPLDSRDGHIRHQDNWRCSESCCEGQGQSPPRSKGASKRKGRNFESVPSDSEEFS